MKLNVRVDVRWLLGAMAVVALVSIIWASSRSASEIAQLRDRLNEAERERAHHARRAGELERQARLLEAQSKGLGTEKSQLEAQVASVKAEGERHRRRADAAEAEVLRLTESLPKKQTPPTKA